MPYHGEWLIPLRVIEAKLWGVITIDDLDNHTKICAELLDEAFQHDPKRTLYLLLDSTEAESLPPLYLMIHRAMPVLRFRNRGPMFFVTKNPRLKNIMDLTAHVMRFQNRTFSTREEALHAIETALVRDEIKNSP